MKTAKLLFYAIVLFLAVFGGIMLFGAIISAAQYLIWLGAILLVGFVAVKLLTKKKKSERPQLETASPAERELQEAMRRIEEIKRAQLPR
jgi:threonine/homoserine/homoserine lactone efflux protein